MMFGPLPDTPETWINGAADHAESAASQMRIALAKVRQWLGERDTRIQALQTENANLRAALAFAASVIRSGEPWTAECERTIGSALAKTNG